MKKFFCIIISFTAIISLFSACSNPQQAVETTSATAITEPETEKSTEIKGELATSGKWGSAKWELYHSGELVFSHNGELDSASEDDERAWMIYDEYISALIISEGVTEIGKNLFSDMKSLAKVSLPESLISVEENAFGGCTSLKEIALPDKVTTVENGAFEGSSLEKIKLGASVSEIGPMTFIECKITDIKVSEQNPFFSTDKYGVLFNKEKTELIWYSCGFRMNFYEVPAGVTEIGQAAFHNEYLTEVKLPDGLETIGKEAFMGCISLKTAEIPSTVTKIGTEAFSGCRSIEEFTFPDGITHISSEVLSECDGLKAVNIPVSVLSIGEKAFGAQETFEINYDGSKDDWKKISIAESNSAITYAGKNYGL